ncbi:cold-shock protein [Amycolatopsis magusensis]|uniref:cold-shock protein n=1 Tax=Amycolatopsis magusensis TaxID=882444 RepID=UPI0024A8D60D|nr:cold shock domain-containing protein [Amycolatopsis magusensis]MDI5977393.1 cold shock domain-containing protein [Amycolatopsis magusensis]
MVWVTSGKILRFDEVRGYGFIAPDEGGEDVFMHANDLRDEKHLFQPGMTVTFDVEDGGRGLKASNVHLADRDAATAAAHQPARPTRVVEDGLADLLSQNEFRQELTEAMLESAPTLTGSQIVLLRRKIVQLAQSHNWVEH